ncbi:hypothetical protein G4B88_000504 [Cannabis sativa]|uniref:Uncharacterized protein n=1 Tax=Cannabis sativa TaxID=3483 RepID=A0A7J6EMR9_CANSA|nr:hypothetical protein G4B88_000504 [Cannabis sativa]
MTETASATVVASSGSRGTLRAPGGRPYLTAGRINALKSLRELNIAEVLTASVHHEAHSFTNGFAVEDIVIAIKNSCMVTFGMFTSRDSPSSRPMSAISHPCCLGDLWCIQRISTTLLHDFEVRCYAFDKMEPINQQSLQPLPLLRK